MLKRIFSRVEEKQDNVQAFLEGKLMKSGLLDKFVKEHEGNWKYDDWEEFLARLKKKGYEKLDQDRIHTLAENMKRNMLDEIFHKKYEGDVVEKDIEEEGKNIITSSEKRKEELKNEIKELESERKHWKVDILREKNKIDELQKKHSNKIENIEEKGHLEKEIHELKELKESLKKEIIRKERLVNGIKEEIILQKNRLRNILKIIITKKRGHNRKELEVIKQEQFVKKHLVNITKEKRKFHDREFLITIKENELELQDRKIKLHLEMAHKYSNEIKKNRASANREILELETKKQQIDDEISMLAEKRQLIMEDTEKLKVEKSHQVLLNEESKEELNKLEEKIKKREEEVKIKENNVGNVIQLEREKAKNENYDIEIRKRNLLEEISKEDGKKIMILSEIERLDKSLKAKEKLDRLKESSLSKLKSDIEIKSEENIIKEKELQIREDEISKREKAIKNKRIGVTDYTTQIDDYKKNYNDVSINSETKEEDIKNLEEELRIKQKVLEEKENVIDAKIKSYNERKKELYSNDIDHNKLEVIKRNIENKEKAVAEKEIHVIKQIKELNKRSLTHYIDSLLDRGFTKEQIKSKLHESGWDDSHIQEIL